MFIMKKNPKSLVAEDYRSLKASIEYSSIDKKLKTLLVTSSNPAEGKTTVLGNLAYALAQNDKKVIIIDGDLRKPTIHKRFRISNEQGLTDVLVGKVSLKECIVDVEKYIHVLPRGTKVPNPAEIVGSKAMEELIKNMCEVYDYVLIDTPPVRNISDAQLLAAKCDGTIFVVKAEETKAQDIQKGYEALKKVKANVIGTVMNCVKKSKDNYYYYEED